MVLGIGKEEAVLGSAAGNHEMPMTWRVLRKGEPQIILLRLCIVCFECKFPFLHHK